MQDLINEVGNVLSQVLIMPTMVFGFMVAEWVRANWLTRFMPGPAQYRLSAILALAVLAINLAAAALTVSGLADLSGPVMREDTEALLFFLVVHPTWWIMRLMYQGVGAIIDAQHGAKVWVASKRKPAPQDPPSPS